jgi:hypothetical protein
VGELFQDSFSSVSDSLSALSDLRTQQVFTFIGTVLTTLGTIFLNTIYKLLIIAVAKVALLSIFKHFRPGQLPDIFQDISLSIQITLEDANIHYTSPGEEYYYKGEDYGSTGYGGEKDHGYVYSNGRKREEKGGLWEDLLDWVVFDVL